MMDGLVPKALASLGVLALLAPACTEVLNRSLATAEVSHQEHLFTLEITSPKPAVPNSTVRRHGRGRIPRRPISLNLFPPTQPR
jgi:hypothetical protein